MPSTPFGFDTPPLDVMSAAPQQPQKAGNQWAQAAPLLAMIPAILARGGPQGLAAFLQARQQAVQQKQQTAKTDAERQAALQRQQTQDDRAYEQQLFQRDLQQGQLERQRAEQQRLFIADFTDKLSKVTSKADADALVGVYGQFGQTIGIPQEQLETVAKRIANEEDLTRKRVESFLNGADEDTVGQWYDAGGSLRIPDVGDVPFDRWSKYATVAVDPKTGKRIPKAKKGIAPEDLSKSSIAVQAADALRRGDMEEYNRLLRVQKEVGLADLAPQRQPIQIQVGGSGLNKDQVTTAAGLRDDYRTESKDFFAARDGYERVLSSAQDPSAAGDLALLYGYMKLLDPNSVVREAEFATAAKSGSLPQQIQAAALRVVNGQRLTPEQRRDFLSRAKTLFGRSQSRQQSRQKRYSDMAARFGLPADLVIADDDAKVDESVLGAQEPAASPRSNVANPFRK